MLRARQAEVGSREMDLGVNQKIPPQREVRELGVVISNVGTIVFEFWLLLSI